MEQRRREAASEVVEVEVDECEVVELAGFRRERAFEAEARKVETDDIEGGATGNASPVTWGGTEIPIVKVAIMVDEVGFKLEEERSR